MHSHACLYTEAWLATCRLSFTEATPEMLAALPAACPALEELEVDEANSDILLDLHALATHLRCMNCALRGRQPSMPS